MNRVLFVDDEKRILEALRRSLRSLRYEWEMAFAISGQAALEQLSTEAFDVIVSDLRMPGMDGAALLSEVRVRHPEIVRIVLSGHAELETLMRAIPVTHRYLGKPCDEELTDVLANLRELFPLVPDSRLRRAIGELDPIPTTQEAHRAMSDVLTRALPDIDEVAMAVRSDLAMTTEVLRLANSSFFDAASRTGSIGQAITSLGNSVLLDLLDTVPVLDPMTPSRAVPSVLIEGGNTHAQLTAELASRLLSDPRAAGYAFTAAMLHDLGELIFASSLPVEYDDVVAESARSGRPVFQVEEEWFGVSHAEIGAYMLGLWGLPREIVTAVANHHHPSRNAPDTLDVVGALHVADALIDELDSAAGSKPSILDEDYLFAVSALDEIPKWRHLAAKMSADVPDSCLSSGIWEIATLNEEIRP